MDRVRKNKNVTFNAPSSEIVKHRILYFYKHDRYNTLQIKIKEMLLQNKLVTQFREFSIHLYEKCLIINHLAYSKRFTRKIEINLYIIYRVSVTESVTLLGVCTSFHNGLSGDRPD